MFRNTVLILTMVLLASLSFAQPREVEKAGGYARLLSLGNNPYVVDPYFTTVNPAWAGVYDNFFWGDIGSQQTPWGNDGVGQFAGFNFGLTDNVTLGAILTRNDFNGLSIGSLSPINSLINGVGLNNTVFALDNNLELLASFKTGRHAIGVGVAYASSTNDFNPAQGNSTENSASQIGINAGILTTISGITLDAGASVILPSISAKPATGSETSYSATIIGIFGRAFLRYNSQLFFVPAVTFVSVSGSGDVPFGTGTQSVDLNSQTLLSVGFGINYQIGDILIVGGPAFAYASNTSPEIKNSQGQTTTPELTTSYSVFPVWNLGAEWKFLDWLVGRIGYVAATGNQTTESQGATTTQINELVQTFYFTGDVTIGLGFRLGSFSLEATINDDILRQGLNNLGGNGSFAGTFAYLSASLSW